MSLNVDHKAKAEAQLNKECPKGYLVKGYLVGIYLRWPKYPLGKLPKYHLGHRKLPRAICRKYAHAALPLNSVFVAATFLKI